MTSLTPWNKIIQSLVLSYTREGIILAQVLMDDYKVISHWQYAKIEKADFDKIDLPIIDYEKLEKMEDNSWKYVECTIRDDSKYMKRLYNEYLEQTNTKSRPK